MSQYRVVLITVPNRDVAKEIAYGLVEDHLAACVNIVSDIQSIYRWQGTIESDTELLLICKTDESQWPALCSWVKQHHPYDVPEIISLPVIQGSDDYLAWVSGCLKK